jgi:hypothetical protein
MRSGQERKESFRYSSGSVFLPFLSSVSTSFRQIVLLLLVPDSGLPRYGTGSNSLLQRYSYVPVLICYRQQHFSSGSNSLLQRYTYYRYKYDFLHDESNWQQLCRLPCNSVGADIIEGLALTTAMFSLQDLHWRRQCWAYVIDPWANLASSVTIFCWAYVIDPGSIT